MILIGDLMELDKYIVFEGADGIGKSMLAKNFAQHFNAKYIFEPFGHTPQAMALREMALTKEIPSLAREYLLLGNRAIGYQTVEKWLAEGHRVVSDRSFISGMVYAYMEGFSFDRWFDMACELNINTKWNRPLVILCHNSQFKNKDNPDDRYDNKPKDFHMQVTKTFFESLTFLDSKLASTGGLAYLAFEIDFNRTPEENLQELILRLTKAGIFI